jgi:Ca2+-transporting ATPase
MAIKRKWHSLDAEDVLSLLKTTSEGLSSAEVQKRLSRDGYNELPQQKPYSKLRLFLNQLRNPLMYILFGTIAVSIFLKHYSDTVFILLVLISNVAVAFYQENKAGNAIASLKRMVKINTQVHRDGAQKEIDSKELVPGDIIVLHSGDKVPADARILESREAKVNEASITGESMPVEKKPHTLTNKLQLADQTNMLFMGTIVEEGSVKAVVVGTGLNTEIGEIVSLLKETEEAPTPLQRQMDKLAKYTAVFILCIISLIFSIGLLRFESSEEILLAALSLAVSAIPAGLLPAITVILVLVMRRILKQNGLVRKLVSTETLGSITVICTDKTGTLTEGKMKVTHLISSTGELSGKKLASFKINDPNPETEAFKQISKFSILTNDAFVENPDAKSNEWIIRGRITEQSLLKQAALMGFEKKLLEQEHILIDKIYFSSAIKFSATLREIDDTGRSALFVVGAPEVIFSKSTQVASGLEQKTQELAKLGLRVIAVAHREFETRPKYKKLHELVENLNLVGLIALEDPIRDEVIEAISVTKKAGIKTIVVTGDHKITAMVIAKKIGLKVSEKEILEGHELQTMSDETLRDRIKSTVIFSRVSPQDKLRIVHALQAHGEIVAMVGDGVNDAPALKSADIGVAVNSGTDVAKEVADLLLLDNGFHTIVKAIEQGRVIFSNIRKVFVYLLADDFQEIYIFLMAMILGLPLPLLPAQILWINLVEDGLPDLALTTEQETAYVMNQPPRPKDEPVVNRPLKLWLTSIFLISGTAALALFMLGIKFTGDLDRARTMVFVLMGLDSLIFAFSARSFRQTIFRRDIFSNKFLVGAVSISFVLLICAIYVPALQKLLSTQSLIFTDWLIVFGFSFVEIVFIEVAKTTFLFRRNRPLMV